METYKVIKYNLHNGRCMEHGFWYFTKDEWQELIEKIKKNKKFLDKLSLNKETAPLVKDFLSGKDEEGICILYLRELFLKKIILETNFI